MSTNTYLHLYRQLQWAVGIRDNTLNTSNRALLYGHCRKVDHTRQYPLLHGNHVWLVVFHSRTVQSISNGIVGYLRMSNVYCESKQKCKKSMLTWRPFIWCTTKSKLQRLVIGEQCELSSFNKTTAPAAGPRRQCRCVSQSQMTTALGS